MIHTYYIFTCVNPCLTVPFFIFQVNFPTNQNLLNSEMDSSSNKENCPSQAPGFLENAAKLLRITKFVPKDRKKKTSEGRIHRARSVHHLENSDINELDAASSAISNEPVKASRKNMTNLKSTLSKSYDDIISALKRSEPKAEEEITGLSRDGQRVYENFRMNLGHTFPKNENCVPLGRRYGWSLDSYDKCECNIKQSKLDRLKMRVKFPKKWNPFKNVTKSKNPAQKGNIEKSSEISTSILSFSTIFGTLNDSGIGLGKSEESLDNIFGEESVEAPNEQSFGFEYLQPEIKPNLPKFAATYQKVETVLPRARNYKESESKSCTEFLEGIEKLSLTPTVKKEWRPSLDIIHEINEELEDSLSTSSEISDDTIELVLSLENIKKNSSWDQDRDCPLNDSVTEQTDESNGIISVATNNISEVKTNAANKDTDDLLMNSPVLTSTPSRKRFLTECEPDVYLMLKSLTKYSSKFPTSPTSFSPTSAITSKILSPSSKSPNSSFRSRTASRQSVRNLYSSFLEETSFLSPKDTTKTDLSFSSTSWADSMSVDSTLATIIEEEDDEDIEEGSNEKLTTWTTLSPVPPRRCGEPQTYIEITWTDLGII